MATNKVIVNNEIKIDLTEDTVTPETLFEGVTAHDKSGNIIVGTFTIDEELDSQDNLIAEIIEALSGIPSEPDEPVVPVASLTPVDGATYTEGISDLDAETVAMIAGAISNNADITNETSEVYFDYEDIHRKVSVGDQVSLPLNGTEYLFDIIGFNHDTLTTAAAYGANTATGKAGMTLQMHDLFATTYQMNSSNTNSGGWKSSAMRTSTMATMKGYLPDDWEAIIKPVNKASGTGGGSSSGTETVSDSCFLLAEIEIFGSTTYSVSGEGTQYAYYKAGNSKVKNKSGFAYDWWERSPYSGNSSYFCYVNGYGVADRSNASYSNGVAFGFCI